MYVVTGGAGFIGSAIVHKLNLEGITDIRIVDNVFESEKWLNFKGLRFSDYMNRDEFRFQVASDKLPFHPKAIIHMGASSSTTETDFEYVIDNNLHYSQELATFAIERDIRFIYASSAATYGNGENSFSDNDDLTPNLNPLNRYGLSKLLFDQWVVRHNLQLKIAGLRFFNVYGPNEYHKGSQASVVYHAFHQAKDSGSIKLFRSYREDYADGEQKRDHVYVKDCAQVTFDLLSSPEKNGIFNVGTGESRTWNELARAVFKAMNIPEKIEYIDMPEQLREHYQYFTEADIAKSKAQSICTSMNSLEDGVEDYVRNYLTKSSQHMCT